MSDEKKGHIDKQVLDLIKKKNADGIIDLINQGNVSDDNSTKEYTGNNYSRIMQFAISQGNIAILEALAAKGFNINQTMIAPQPALEGMRFVPQYKLPPVFYAIMQAKPEIVQWFIDREADIHASVEGIRFMDADGIRFVHEGKINALSALGIGVGREMEYNIQPVNDLRLVKIKEIVQIFVDCKLKVNEQFNEANEGIHNIFDKPGILNNIFDRTKSNKLLQEILKNLVAAGLDLENVINRDYRRQLMDELIKGFPMVAFAQELVHDNRNNHVEPIVYGQGIDDHVAPVPLPSLSVKAAKSLAEEFFKDTKVCNDVHVFKEEILKFLRQPHNELLNIKIIEQQIPNHILDDKEEELQELFTRFQDAKERGGSWIKYFVDYFRDFVNKFITSRMDASLETQFVTKQAIEISSIVKDIQTNKQQNEL